MIPSEYGSAAAAPLKCGRGRGGAKIPPAPEEVRGEQVRDDDPPAFVDLRPLQCARQQLQLGELNRFVDVLEHPVHVGACFDELGGQAQSLGRRVRVLKTSGVRDERDVERLGDLRCQLDVELAEYVSQDLARRGGVGDDQVRLPETRVVVVVVDVDGERDAAEDLRVGDAA